MSESHDSNFEIWRPIPGYPNYEASNFGRIRSIDRIALVRGSHRTKPFTRRKRGQIIKPNSVSGGRAYAIEIAPDKNATVHSLIMLTFVGPRPAGMHICHNDGNPWNNHLANLRYDTAKANFNDMVKHGRGTFQQEFLPARKVCSSSRKLTLAQAEEILRRAKSEGNYDKIANDFGVSQSTVSHIANGRNWPFLSGKMPEGRRPRAEGDIYTRLAGHYAQYKKQRVAS